MTFCQLPYCKCHVFRILLATLQFLPFLFPVVKVEGSKQECIVRRKAVCSNYKAECNASYGRFLSPFNKVDAGRPFSMKPTQP